MNDGTAVINTGQPTLYIHAGAARGDSMRYINIISFCASSVKGKNCARGVDSGVDESIGEVSNNTVVCAQARDVSREL
ncbi:MAG: hypothetical protein Q8R39_01050 [bacterium]|nr:hypothetical protein [bacterium]